jgi:Tat protein secretion system quality control protein TatD with DNase activity
MAPVPFRSRVAHPGYIPLVAETIAIIKSITRQQVLEQVRLNVHRVYGITF